MKTNLIVTFFVALLTLGSYITDSFQADANAAEVKVTNDNLEQFLQKAENGNVEAQYAIGAYYLEQKDNGKALTWLRKAIGEGHTGAQNKLGEYYYNINDYNNAVKWFRVAAKNGLSEAQYALGRCYHKGEGVNQNYDEAVKWYCEAADNGHAKAQYELGLCYEHGDGVDQNYAKAVTWYRKAAEQGYDLAQSTLGLCYYRGKGVEQDYTEAAKWSHKAAEQGNVQAKELYKLAKSSELKNKATAEAIAELKTKPEVELSLYMQAVNFKGKDATVPNLLTYGTSELMQNMKALVEKRYRADAFDKPEIDKEIRSVERKIKSELNEINGKTFYQEYSYSPYDSSVKINGNTANFPISVNREFYPIGEKFVFTSPFSDIDCNVIRNERSDIEKIVDQKLGRVSPRWTEILISGGTENIKKLVRGKANYRIKVWFKNFQAVYNKEAVPDMSNPFARVQSVTRLIPVAEVTKIEIIDTTTRVDTDSSETKN
jgi:TPR repeat protein